MLWLNNWWQRYWGAVEPALVIAISAIVFAWYQAIPTLPDPDAFYHARFVALMIEHGILYQFPWLPLTTLGDAFADHHLLYHMSMMPAVYALGPMVGVKVMQALFAVTLVLVGYGLLRRWKIPYAGPAMLLLFSSYPMLVRMNLVKASVVAVILFILILAALLERKYAAAAILTMVYSLTHGGFFLAGVLAVVIWIAQALTGYWQQRDQFKPRVPTGVLAVTLAMVLGVVCNPYFPSNMPFLWAQFFQIGVVNYSSVIAVGAEWYPFPLTELVGATSILLIGLVPVIAIVVVQRKTILANDKFVALLILTPVLLVLTLRSRRFIEYLVPVLWLLVCVLVLPALHSGLIKQWWKQLSQHVGKLMPVINVYLVFAVTFGVCINYVNLFHDFAGQDPLDRFAGAGAYLRTVTQSDQVVFHGKWDDFPELFYYDSNAAYVVGLDATFLYLENKERYGEWRKISEGQAKQETAQLIRDKFQSRYVVVDKTDEPTKLMLAYLLRDSSVQTAYEDKQMIVFDLGVWNGFFGRLL